MTPESHELAVTEDGRTLSHATEDEVNCALKLLIFNGNDVARTVRTMREYGYETTRDKLSRWRDSSFKTRHYNMRREMANEIGEELAGKALERAIQADEVEGKLITRLGDNVDEIEPKDLPRGIQALAQAKSSDIEKAQLLRDKPTEIVEKRSVSELYAEMKSLNIVVNVDEDSERPPKVLEDVPAGDPS